MNYQEKGYKKKQKRNSSFTKQLRRKPTSAEVKLGMYLFRRKIYFIYQKGFLTPFHRIADFYLPVRNIIIEVDGAYHVKTLDKDNLKDLLWLKRGIKTVRIKNEEVFSGEFAEKLEPYIYNPIEKDTKIHSSVKWYFKF